MIDIGDDGFADLRFDFRDEGDAARRHIDGLAGIFLPVLQHIAAGELDLHALMLAPLLVEREHANCASGRLHHGDRPIFIRIRRQPNDP